MGWGCPHRRDRHGGVHGDVEGITAGIGTAIGALGGPLGAEIGAVVGETLGKLLKAGATLPMAPGNIWQMYTSVSQPWMNLKTSAYDMARGR